MVANTPAGSTIAQENVHAESFVIATIAVPVEPLAAASIVPFEPFGGVQFTKTGLSFNKAISIEDWTQLGTKLKQIEGAIQFWIGDWLRYGEKAYGEEYTEAAELTGTFSVADTLSRATRLTRNPDDHDDANLQKTFERVIHCLRKRRAPPNKTISTFNTRRFRTGSSSGVLPRNARAGDAGV